MLWWGRQTHVSGGVALLSVVLSVILSACTPKASGPGPASTPPVTAQTLPTQSPPAVEVEPEVAPKPDPNRDSDGDGLPDIADTCPHKIELFNDVDDDDGCPDRGAFGIRLDINGEMLLRDDKIYWLTNKPQVHPRSVEQVAAIATVIRDNPALGNIRIEVHTDDRGARAYNLRLSQARADAVVARLLEHGVAATRLRAVGYGHDRPIVSEAPPPAGREMTRRTEFWLERPVFGSAP